MSTGLIVYLAFGALLTVGLRVVLEQRIAIRGYLLLTAVLPAALLATILGTALLLTIRLLEGTTIE